jgi:pimeloyl-ACP methyl ester carboxylesterase
MSGHGSHAHPSPGVSIDYFAAGAGQPLVLVHGITESRRTWDPLVAPLIDAGYRVIAVDLRGHGASSRVGPYDLVTMAGDLGAVLQAEDAVDALLVGHSLGGAVVTAYAAGGPCRGVVNVDQPLSLGGFQSVLRDLQPSLEGGHEAFTGAITAIFDQMAGPLVGAERRRVDHLRSDHIRDAGSDVVLGVWDMMFTATAEEIDASVDALAASIDVPYLSLHGIDPGPDYPTWLAERIPNAVVEVWPEHGHYPHLMDGSRFVQRVVTFDA